MFGTLGFWEVLLILLVALIVVGPRRLPDIARTIGSALGEFRRATHEMRSTLEAEVREIERQAVVPPPVEVVEPDDAEARRRPDPESPPTGEGPTDRDTPPGETT